MMKLFEIGDVYAGGGRLGYRNMNSGVIEYLTDSEGEPSAVVIPIELWRRIFPDGVSSTEAVAEGIEDYCLNRAMDEAKETPLLDREAALAFLEGNSD